MHAFLGSITNFNPRSHEGSDASSRSGSKNRVIISIHAPTRGATSVYFDAFTQSFISIHAPTRGATIKATSFSLTSGFQSTLPRGERPLHLLFKLLELLFQSTLPRGERPVYFAGLVFVFIISIPRSHEGERRILSATKQHL